MLKCHLFCYYIYSKMCQTFSCAAYVDSFFIAFYHPMLGNPRLSCILDSMPWILDPGTGFWIP